MKKKLTDILYSFSLLLFITAFGFQHNPPSGWYQQFMPDLGGRQINDITFTDSLNGYAITSRVSDTSYILRTTDGGDNWFTIRADSGSILSRIQFINQNTGFIGGLKIVNNSFLNIIKTTNAGANWFYINTPFDTYISDMSVLNDDTIHFAMGSSIGGGVFRTTNGGSSWQLQYSAGSNNPQKIYMHDANLGFISTGVTNSGLRRTTDGGVTWTEIPGVGGFLDLKFIDENTGWKARSGVAKTTDGGLNWFGQPLPQLNWVNTALKVTAIDGDTLWAIGGVVQWVPSTSNFRGVVYKTTNSGEQWGYQIPDTSVNYYQLTNIDFVKKLIGWVYLPSEFGFHTVTAGDTTFFTSVSQISTLTPEDYNLYQNYPNPFNPVTKIKFDIPRAGEVKLIVYDMLGKEISILVNEKLSTGSYEYSFDASGLSSGVFFYSLKTEKIKITKKMLLLR